MSEKKIYISEPEDVVSETAATSEAVKSPRKRTTPKAKAKEEITYEAAVARLEEIVRKLEQSREGIGLEESMKLYEEGVSLVRRCYRELEAAEQRVKVLQQTADGEIIAVDFDTDNQ
ncbi:MAG: exodeoxyribonuclease VII small subunit [Ruminococcaceae bacterium]|nr:exodeoxyribonuclease VII small subunit [Oscillospiraceae bacterium]